MRTPKPVHLATRSTHRRQLLSLLTAQAARMGVPSRFLPTRKTQSWPNNQSRSTSDADVGEVEAEGRDEGPVQGAVEDQGEVAGAAEEGLAAADHHLEYRQRQKRGSKDYRSSR